MQIRVYIGVLIGGQVQVKQDEHKARVYIADKIITFMSESTASEIYEAGKPCEVALPFSKKLR